MLKTDKSGIFKKTQIMNEKIVEDNVKFIKKEQLIEYIQFLINKYTVSLFSDYGDTKEMIIKKIKRKTKINIVDIINYNLFSKDIKQNIKLAIKGIDENSKDLIKVKVTKTVNKIIQ
jgi:alpha-amylase/alpha-mannosidase (GH57 family)